MINTIIIEDEELARINLQRLLEKIEAINLVGVFENPIDAIKKIDDIEVDLMFLDLHMPDFSGFDLLKNKNNLPPTIITTSDETKALDAYEFNVIDYLLKPINLARLLKSIEKYKLLHQNKDTKSKVEEVDHIYVNSSRRLIKIDFKDLYIVEAKGDYIVLKTENKDYIIHSSMKKIEEKLPFKTFLKIHRSFIINTDKIIDIEDNSVFIKKDVIPISRSNRKTLMDKLNMI